MATRNYDDWTIDRWRIEPRFRPLDLDVTGPSEQNPPLWKDVTTALVIALVLWAMAAIVLP